MNEIDTLPNMDGVWQFVKEKEMNPAVLVHLFSKVSSIAKKDRLKPAGLLRMEEFKTFYATIRSNYKNLNERNIVSLIVSLQKLEMRDLEVLKWVRDEIMEGRLQGMTPMGLSAVLFTFAKFGIDDEELIVKIVKTLEINQPPRKDIMVRNLWALSRLGYKNDVFLTKCEYILEQNHR